MTIKSDRSPPMLLQTFTVTIPANASISGAFTTGPFVPVAIRAETTITGSEIAFHASDDNSVFGALKDEFDTAVTVPVSGTDPVSFGRMAAVMGSYPHYKIASDTTEASERTFTIVGRNIT